MSFGPEFRLPQPLFDADKSGSGGGQGGTGTETIAVSTKDNMGSATVIIKPGENGAPGSVVDVVRPPAPPKP